MAKSKSINLLPQEEFEASTLGRILHWAMGSFRIIVIITEMVVMGAFLSRFWLDAKNSDISNSIKIASSQIEVQSDFEKRFRDVQKKLSIFKSIDSNTKPSTKVQTIADKTPQGVIITSIIANNISTSIKGDADSEEVIAQFIGNLKADPSVKAINLGSLNSSKNNESLISFEVMISY